MKKLFKLFGIITLVVFIGFFTTCDPDDDGNTVETPITSISAGTYIGTQTIILSTFTSGATIYFTINGETPTINSTQYTTAVTVNKTMTIKAIAIKNGMTNSDIFEAKYTIMNYIVSTLAGTGTDGYIDGDGNIAQFNQPIGIAIDSEGNIFLADMNNHRIRKITPQGVVSTLAGTGTEGFTDGEKGTAQFKSPCGIAVDSEGNIYVADTLNNRIRKITPQGIVSTLAGNGTDGLNDGAGSTALFFSPTDLTIDLEGYIYVADMGNHRIRKITPQGEVSTFAGTGDVGFGYGGFHNGLGHTARFDSPHGVAVDLEGNIYVADSLNNRIRKITSQGVVSTLAGNGTDGLIDGVGSASQFFYPSHVALDSLGNIYVADNLNNSIRKITPSGVVSTIAGNGIQGFYDGSGNIAQFNMPTGIAVDYEGNIYVVDTGNIRIRKIVLVEITD
ncbi:MAG: chitobiase/beta-hexosaminidase C-terminal domain-containing protein [Treponema sp.]|nr:chitobiase/beta-hexosaminidase C-terminal domain-containing protein [Treponema sp.]